jgi:hypothetical protein
MWGMDYGKIANMVKDGEVVKAGVAVSDGFVGVLARHHFAGLTTFNDFFGGGECVSR